MSDRDIQFIGDPNQVGERCRLHLLHDLTTVDLKRDFADAEFGCRLLVQQAADHQRQHLALPRRQSREAATKLGPLNPYRPLQVVPVNGRANRRHQLPLPHRLGQKVDSAALNGAHRRWDVAMSCDENDRWVVFAGKLFLEIEAVDIRQLDVEDQTRRNIGLRIGYIVTGGGERLSPPSQGLQELAERRAHSGVVVHKEDDFPVLAHNTALAVTWRSYRPPRYIVLQYPFILVESEPAWCLGLAFQGRFYGLDQLRRIDGLAKDASIVGSGNPTQVDVTAGRDENDGQLRPHDSHALLQLDAIHTGHSDVGNQGIDFVHHSGSQERFCRIKQTHGITRGFQQLPE